ncbi:hypothetical protein SERLADRAFT_418850 [Serpula lacrymans var. lacrymans S7.9]|uniref:RRN6 beta-propeller domain-containing protein n=1 Tax=Serpula lacrymans var. lacrymans (strain S7.9) TaxID=578457 RepID=F8PE67_SERL9|nr:uncharacterized protein SERLADRAFT_418850 [Serpula lacrymans var. lacrymans S7.9]EGO18664.1 hypothetical protein SERLADRAFT_418850 [Serpula lacrymans var. lacrymans S7.9]
MDHWPADERQLQYDNPQKLRKGKSKEVEIACQFPRLDHGSLGAATLVQQNGRLQWTILAENSNRRSLSPMGHSVKVFPETRPPPLYVPSSSIVHRAEQGAHFLRTYFPDVDIHIELIRNEMEEDTKVMRDLEAFDTRSGNLLDTINCNKGPNDIVSLVLFPMGEANRDLNISCMKYGEHSRDVVFEASPRAAYTFDTPIQHIVTPSIPCETDEAAYAIVRSFASTSLMSVTPPSISSGISVSEVVNFGSSDAGGHSIADARLLSAQSGVVMVNEKGHVYHYDVYDGNIALQLNEASTRFRPNANDSFFKLALSKSHDGCILADKNSLARLDFRSDEPIELFRCRDLMTFVTAIEQPEPDHIIRLSTTNEILWLDDRFGRQPLLSYKHNRDFDRTLETVTVRIGNNPLTLLTSRKNGLISVYDVSRSTDGLLYSGASPHSLLTHTYYTARPGHSAVVLPSTTDMSMLHLSSRGSIHRQDFRLVNTRDTGGTPVTIGDKMFEWSTEVQKLDTKARKLRSDPGPLGARAFSESDLHDAYKKLFLMDAVTNLQDENEPYHETVENIPLFWQRTGGGVEQMLNTFDIAFRSGDEPGEVSRADFLTAGIVNSRRGYRALLQGHLPPQSLVERAPWHYRICNSTNQFHTSPSGDWQALYESLSGLDLTSDPAMPGPALRRQSEAREQLVLDLALSSDIFAARPFVKPSSSNHGDMSLMDEPREVDYGYLHPTPKHNTDHYAGLNGNAETSKKPMSNALGVRLLLREWDIGIAPGDYVYHDPYGQTGKTALGYRKQARPNATTATETVAVRSQRPPMVVTSLAPALSRFPEYGSQPQGLNHGRPSTQVLPTQDHFASTQVLPGANGGRPFTNKKKIVKKRLACKKPTLCRAKRTNLDSSAGPENNIHGWNKASSPPNPFFDQASFNESLRRHKPVVCALSASYISTLAGYPLDSLKSRLQTTKTRISVPRLAALIYREEGVIGFYRGLWIPLMTISFVRAASFTIYSSTKEYCRGHHYFDRQKVFDAAITGGIAGALSGSLISFGSAPFELVKVRRQLEYTIAASKGIQLVKAPGTYDAVRDIFRNNGIKGLYIGFRLHFLRDMSGTALYFFEYDAMRHLLGRRPSGEQGSTPPWLPIPVSLIPFVCGSLAGVTSWALIYPLDVVKTKVQQRALAGNPPRGVLETFLRLVRGPDPRDPKPMLAGVARIYRGLGVSALRSITTHGLLWTLFDMTSSYIDGLP